MDMYFLIASVLFYFECCSSEMVEICNVSVLQQCTFSVSSNSASEMASELRSSNSLLVETKLNFRQDVHSSNGTILPNHWIMTQVDKRSENDNFFTSWPVDYSLVTLGTLDSRTLKHVTLNISTFPTNCSVIIGNQDTNCGLVTALVNASQKERRFDKNSKMYWCYISEYSDVRNETIFLLHMYFNIPIRLFGFRCCHKKNDNIFCNHIHTVKLNEYETVPLLLGIAFFCFFPIFLMQCSSNAMKSGRKVTSTRGHYMYEDLDFDEEEWIFLQKRHPITILGILLGIFSLGSRHPVAASRIRRICYVFCTPFVVYIEIYMYFKGWPEFVKAVVKAKLPFGFASIAGGISDSRHAFVPIFGGPFVSIILYFVFGVLALAIPRDHGDVIEKGMSVGGHAPVSLLQLDIAKIEELSYISCINYTGYRKIYALLKASVCMVINPKFWSFVIHFFIKRWRFSVYPIFTAICKIKYVQWSIYILVLLLYILVSVIETTLAVIYYAIPMIQFLIIVSKGHRVFINEQVLDRHLLMKFCLGLMCPIVLLFYIYFSCLIIIESLYFLSKVIFFLYLAVVIFPNYTFSSVYSTLMLLFFFYRICSEIEKDYHNILCETIEAVNYIKTANLKQDKCEDSSMEMINEMHVVGDKSTDIGDFSTESRHLPGIRRDLFDYIVRKYRPIHVAVFLAIAQMGVMTFLVLSSNMFVSKYVHPMKTDEPETIVHVMTTLLITILPNLVYSCFTQRVNHNVRKLKIRQTIVDFVRIELQ